MFYVTSCFSYTQDKSNYYAAADPDMHAVFKHLITMLVMINQWQLLIALLKLSLMFFGEVEGGVVEVKVYSSFGSRLQSSDFPLDCSLFCCYVLAKMLYVVCMYCFALCFYFACLF